jgi:hypothetical protein
MFTQSLRGGGGDDAGTIWAAGAGRTETAGRVCPIELTIWLAQARHRIVLVHDQVPPDFVR